MDRIIEKKISMYYTTDGKEFKELDKAKKHQKEIDKSTIFNSYSACKEYKKKVFTDFLVEKLTNQEYYLEFNSDGTVQQDFEDYLKKHKIKVMYAEDGILRASSFYIRPMEYKRIIAETVITMFYKDLVKEEGLANVLTIAMKGADNNYVDDFYMDIVENLTDLRNFKNIWQ